MFAILETGSKQYKVEEGDVLEVELLDKEKITDDNKFDFNSVLLVQDKELHIGQPFVKDAVITASVLDEFKAPKIIIFKKKSKKQYKKTRGHRQQLHRIKIEKIAFGNAKPAPKKKAAAKKTTNKVETDTPDTEVKAAEPKDKEKE